MIKRYSQEQILDGELLEIWSFISTPSNLNAVTPDWLEFRIVSDPPPEIHNGLLIEYEIKIPFFGRQKWVSEIKNVETCRCFADEQKVGPYRFWYHFHELQKVSAVRTRMVDFITYDVGYGPFGWLADRFYVKRNIQKIFAYRKDALSRMFNEP